MVIINLKVKTLNQGDHNVEIDDEQTLSGLRELVAVKTEIATSRLRFIFQGRCLEDNLKILKNYGLENNMALHVVEVDPSAPPLSATRNRRQPGRAELPRRATPLSGQLAASFFIQHAPFFDNSEDLAQRIRRLLIQIQEEFNVSSQIFLNPVSEREYNIVVALRRAEQIFENSPARIRYEYLLDELLRWTWGVLTIIRVFIPHVDSIFDDTFVDLGEVVSSRILIQALHGMHLLDLFHLPDVQAFHSRFSLEDPLKDVLDALADFQIADDEAHNQGIDENYIIRHVTAMDLHWLLAQIDRVDSQFGALLTRYRQVLDRNLSFEPSDFKARLLNAFMAAITRSQHHRAHLYHLVSDLNVHIDNNPFHRLFPQYEAVRPELPALGNIRFTFRRTTQPTNNEQQQTGRATTNSTPPTPGIFFAGGAMSNPTQQQQQQNGTAAAPTPSRFNNPGVDILSFMPGGLRRFFPGGVPARLLHSNVAQQNPSPTTSSQPTNEGNVANNGVTVPSSEEQAQRASISQIILEFGIVEADSLDTTNETEDTDATVEPMDTTTPEIIVTTEAGPAPSSQGGLNASTTTNAGRTFTFTTAGQRFNPIAAAGANIPEGARRRGFIINSGNNDSLQPRTQTNRDGWLPWPMRRNATFLNRPGAPPANRMVLADPFFPCFSHHYESYLNNARHFNFFNQHTHPSELDPRTSLAPLTTSEHSTETSNNNNIGGGGQAIRQNVNRFGLQEFQNIDEFEAFARNAFQRLALRFAHPDRVRRHRLENLTDANHSPFYHHHQASGNGDPFDGVISISAELPLLVGTAVSMNNEEESTNSDVQNTTSNPPTIPNSQRSTSTTNPPTSQMEDLD